MKFILRIIIVLMLFSQCSRIQKLYVSFAEAKEEHQAVNDSVIRIYFDRMGYIYPNIKLTNKELYDGFGMLRSVYSYDTTKYAQACLKYKVNYFQPNIELPPYHDALQEALIHNYASLINAKSFNRNLVFVIHGFNEFPVDGRDSSSFREMRLTRKRITDQFSTEKFQFVEIYWDGLSHEGGPKILRYPNSFFIWNNSQCSAMNAGLELRRLFTKLESKKINIVTHSHGAGVITAALFNVKKFDKRDWLYSDKFTNEINKMQNSKTYDSPTQEYYVGMLAPAIPGVNVFDEYFKRTINGIDTTNQINNYHFIIGFNENDPVTSKYRVAAKKLGSTTLACKREELLKTEKMFLGKNIMDHVDFSLQKDGKPQADHSWFEYLNNDPKINEFLSKSIK